MIYKFKNVFSSKITYLLRRNFNVISWHEYFEESASFNFQGHPVRVESPLVGLKDLDGLQGLVGGADTTGHACNALKDLHH